VRAGSLSLQLGLAGVQRTQLRRQLVRELGQPSQATTDKVELTLDHRSRFLDDPRALAVGRALGPLVPQRCTRFFRIDHLQELLERESSCDIRLDRLEPVGAPAGEVASTCWYLAPRSSEATAAMRHGAIANVNA
jgi:hypothetical protein